MEQKRLNDLQANWIWVPGWIDSCEGDNTAGRVVAFTREFNLEQPPDEALIHCSADTRYKLIVNGKRVAVGPSRSSSLIWYYDTLDIRPWFKTGSNVIEFLVLRYFSTARAAFPFERTIYPGLTVVGNVRAGEAMVDLCSAEGWQAQVYNHIQFPMGLPDDVFLHIYERVVAPATTPAVAAKAYQVRTLNGDLSTWRLRRREIPMYEETPLAFTHVRGCQSVLAAEDWQRHISDGQTLTLDGGSTHVVELQAECHSTAFLRFRFRAVGAPSSIKAKITYSEGYELEPRSYPFFRSKGDRLDAEVGHLIGPFDETRLDLEDGQTVDYEPFWFRTFRIIRVELQVGSGSVEMSPPKATQVNYPMAVKASWKEPGNPTHEQMLEVSIRTMRNCMFDGYSDCPFYEQLQYAGDSRTVALFHYLLSGDDRLMRQAIQNFAASATPEGLTQSRFPSHVHQIIAGFSLYWVLQVCDHHLFFGDTKFSRSFLPRIDGVLEFFDAHVDSLGLVSGMPEDVWHFVDWVTTWGATDEHPDKGVPTSGRKSNRHTYFSMLYAYVLKAAARLVRDVGRPGHAEEYEARAKAVVQAIRTHCYDGQFFTDSTADVAGDDALSQHCQVFAVLCGAAEEGDRERILPAAFSPGGSAAFSKCSYMMTFYALRAHALAGDAAYERLWKSVWDPWRRMLGNNLSTWEEDDVRQRSDCHAWGSVPVFEFLAEVAGVHPTAPGASEISFRPRVRLSAELEAKVALGRSNVATVSWRTGADGVKRIEMTLLSAVVVVSQLPGREERHHGLTDRVSLEYSG